MWSKFLIGMGVLLILLITLNIVVRVLSGDEFNVQVVLDILLGYCIAALSIVTGLS